MILKLTKCYHLFQLMRTNVTIMLTFCPTQKGVMLPVRVIPNRTKWYSTCILTHIGPWATAILTMGK